MRAAVYWYDGNKSRLDIIDTAPLGELGGEIDAETLAERIALQLEAQPSIDQVDVQLIIELGPVSKNIIAYNTGSEWVETRAS